MNRILLTAHVLLLQLFCTSAQTSLDGSLCIAGSGVTSLATCDYFEKERAVCDAKAAKVDRVSCLCNQEMFNAAVEYV
jgi:hypothetical protein